MPDLRWFVAVVLIAANCWTVLLAGQQRLDAETLLGGASFAVPVMAILLTHEFGHYVAARIHTLDISPPYFVPLPLASTYGTMGAVMVVHRRIRTRRALLDLGVSGPLAGLVVAIPVFYYGVATSPVLPLPTSGHLRLAGGLLGEWGLHVPVGAHVSRGYGLLHHAIIHFARAPIAEGHYLALNGWALAGWLGMLFTALNILPFGQLDGGHIAYAAFGRRHAQISSWVLRGLLMSGVATSAYYLTRGWLRGDGAFAAYGNAFAGAPWLVWFCVLLVVARAGGKEHPPTGRLCPDDPQYDGPHPDDERDAPLGPGRRAVAYFTLALCVVLFAPAWAHLR